MDDIFRKFFTFPRYGPRDERHWDDEPYEGPIENDVDPFQPLFSEPHEMFQHFERQFDEIFRSFGFMDFNVPSLPNDGGVIMPLPPANEENAPLRDRLLKQPDSEQHPRKGITPSPPKLTPWLGLWTSRDRGNHEDKDLDSVVTKGGLSGLLQDTPNSDESDVVTRPRQSFHRSSTFTSIRRADGKIEEQRRQRDSMGNEETVVTRKVGDRAHSVVTRRDKDGVVEHQENFVNVDESNLGEFEKEWSSAAQRGQPLREDPLVPPRVYGDPTAPGLFAKLFGSIMPPSPRPGN